MYPIQTRMLTPNKYSRPQTRIRSVKGIVIHWTANEGRGADAFANIRYFENRKYGKTGYGSAHYFVDSKRIVQCLPDNEMAYHVGAKKYKTSRFGGYPNNSTLGIEMCVNSDGNFGVMYEQTVQLAAMLLKKYNLNPDKDLVRHYDITGKNCPGMFTSDHWGRTNNSYAIKYGLGSSADKAWIEFKKDVKAAMKGVKVTGPAQASSSSRSYIMYGDSGSRVRDMQEKLKKAGYTITVDGLFGTATERVVREFQQNYYLTVDGIFGVGSEKKLNEVIEKGIGNVDHLNQYGDKGPLVLKMQKELASLGYKITQDGSFGPATRNVVKQFQKDNGLAADGYYGPSSQKKMAQLLKTKKLEEAKKVLAKVFNDVNEEYWAYEEIKSLKEKGIVGGDQDGNYRPNGPATRAHLAVMLNRTLEYIEKKL